VGAGPASWAMKVLAGEVVDRETKIAIQTYSPAFSRKSRFNQQLSITLNP
jgi:hypothetical protein